MQIGLILDLVFVALVVLTAYLSAKKGFLLLFLDIAASVFAFLGARMACSPVAHYIYDNYLHETVLQKTKEYMDSGSDSVNGVLDSINGILTNISAELGSLVSGLGILPEITGEQTAMTAQTFESTYLMPIITGVITAIAMVVIAIVLLVVLRIVARILDKVIIRKPLKKLNEALGWILGAVKGLIPVFIIACILVIISPVIEKSGLNTLVNTSYLCKLASFVLEKISL